MFVFIAPYRWEVLRGTMFNQLKVMKKYKINYKEVGKEHIGTCYHSGNLSKDEVIEFFGLNEPDVEWYEIIEEKEL